MKARTTPNANIDKTENGYLLKIPAGDSSSYRFAQIDDYFGLSRRKFPHHSLTLSLRAKTSSSSLPGTWGFGLWNDPFGMSLGFGGKRWQLPTLPNAVWFFGASQQNYLSFTDNKPAQGFLAQSFRSPKFHPLLIPAGLALPFSRKQTRKLLGKIIEEDSVGLSSAETCTRNSTSKLVNSRVDPTQWNRYRLEWSKKRVAWYVDDALVFESPVSPNPLLGLVIWIDNQFAAFPPDGKIGFGVLENPEPAWLEISDLSLV
ncbi:MAG: family 16 glycosylhydrolase [Chloroflexi bacterium]|nr:family 16 glycosylhydrolase [Chloroflexota bacterium]